MELERFTTRVLKIILPVILCLTIIMTFIPWEFVKNIVFAAGESYSQTKYKSITEFQNARWTEIQNSVFDHEQNFTTVQRATAINDMSVKAGNPYFNWTDTSKLQGYDNDGKEVEGGLIPYSGTPSAPNSTEITETNIGDYINYQGTKKTISNKTTFTVYNVYTADQFVWILQNRTSNITKVNICADIDMGGAKKIKYNNQRALSGTMYFEGNGHTIYNLKIYGTDQRLGLFKEISSSGKLIVRNLGFQSTMLLHDCNSGEPTSGLWYGYCVSGSVYFTNVHLSVAFFQQNANTSNQGIGLLGGKGNYKHGLFNNCSTSNSYIYGKGHVGGTFSYINSSASISVNYKASYPKNPEAFVLSGTALFPIMFNNCYSIDCELFSTGADSGAFISCGAGILATNCYTNNTMYSNNNTGAFIGRVIHGQCMYDDANKKNIGSYFSNCYTSGIVEGERAMGGFTGFDCGYRAWNHTDSQSGASVQTNAATVYSDCYSTTMVGMDYTGKFCGGFVGLDDNYSSAGTSVTSSDEKQIKNVYGSIYMNCYAAGEVGNILTVTDCKNAVEYDSKFYKEGYYKSSNNLSNYYPSGGFIGAINPDAYCLKTASPVNNNKTGSTFGYFYNCYYDMQTTAMHEMAIGLAYAETCRDDETGKNTRKGTSEDTKVIHKDANGNEIPFSVIGITGLYTEKSDVKKIAGLTGQPSEYTNANGDVLSHMSMDSEDGTQISDNSLWEYNEGYYPQLKSFMISDSTVENLKNATEKDVTEEIKKSSFYIEDSSAEKDSSGNVTCNETHPVLSLANDVTSLLSPKYTEFTPNTENKSAAQIANVARAYRYSQASTSTVFLDHWDYTMDTNSGEVGAENDWVVGLPINAMKKVIINEGKENELVEWQKTYTNLQAGTYDFKVQANTSWAYNYGANGFNGNQNLSLVIPKDDCKAIIRFHYASLKSQEYYVYADIYNKDGTFIETETLAKQDGDKYQEIPYTVAGSFDIQWEASSDNGYKMSCVSNDGKKGIYKYTFKNLAEGEYNFKITDGNGWTNNWGQDGKVGGDNMSFKVDSPCDVTITFDEKTLTCDVTGDYISNVNCTSKTIDYEGYSVIFSSDVFTGYEWLPTGKEVEAATAGAMTYNESTKCYEKEVVLPPTDKNGNDLTGRNYGYKVIKDAVDAGENNYFFVNSSNKNTTIKILYNPETGKSEIAENEDISEAVINSYVVAGNKNLTGYNWLEDVGAAEAGKMTTVQGNSTLYSITFKDKPADTYKFKIVGDGTWSSGISWGDSNSDDGNYTFTLTDKCDVTIYFDTTTHKISVSAEYLQMDKYVLCGTSKLMKNVLDETGAEVGAWNAFSPVMTYNETTGKYEYDLKNVPTNETDIVPDGQREINSNYAYKIISYGKDTGSNIIFALYGDETSYNLHFEYDAKTTKSTIKVYNSNNQDVTEQVLKYDVKVSFYSILGDENLTGDNWGNSNPSLAAYNGRMTLNPNTGYYEKTYRIKVPTNGTSTEYSFKVAANGTWDSGISWGDSNGGNVTVSVSSIDEEINEADLTIYFDPNTGKIWFKTNPESVSQEITDENFTWYIVGTYTLRSDNGYTYDTYTYDTVRDITSKFTFTCGEDTKERALTWTKNTQKNKDSDFKDTGKFDLNYYVDGKNVTGTFEGDVIDLKIKAIKDENYTDGDDADKLLAQYYSEDFMPGKQWLTVKSFGKGNTNEYKKWKEAYLNYNDYKNKEEKYNRVFDKYLNTLSGTDFEESKEGKVTKDNLIDYLNKDPKIAEEVAKKLRLEEGVTLLTLKQDMESCIQKTEPEELSLNESIFGSRNLRLIPTAYLEAGNDAKINVFQSDSDISGSLATNVVKYSDTNDNSGIKFNDALSNNGFGYYNFALTAGYLITDKIGLGIYNNYEKQEVVNYRKDRLRDDDKNEDKIPNTYYAMSSVYNNNDTTQSMGEYSDNGDRSGANLTVGEFRNESSIGASKKIIADTTTDSGKTTESQAKTIVKVFKHVQNTDGSTTLSLVNMDKSSTSIGIYHNNYLKWTGQKNFTASDEGTYTVTFYWTLSDGRYLTDSKEVQVVVLKPSLTKDVNITCTNTSNKENSLEYTVTYRNDTAYEKLSFAVLDILPFDGSKRSFIDVNNEEYSNTTKYKNNNWKIKSVRVTQSNEVTKIKGLYYSNAKDIQSQYDASTKNAAEGIINTDATLNSSAFTAFKKDTNLGDNDYSYAQGKRNVDIDNATALLLTGSELGIGESVTLIFTVEYQPTVNDVYVNNAHFYLLSADGTGSKVSGNCAPVTTAVVSRNFSGYAWLDTNRDGVYNTEENVIKGIKVTLCDSKGTPVTNKDGDLYSTITDENGKYEFKNVPKGDYIVKFEAPDDGDGKVYVGDKEYDFSKLKVSKTKSEAEFKNTLLNSRNISSGIYDNDKLNYAYFNIELPSDNDIYGKNWSPKTIRNKVLNGYEYNKTIQNVAFYDEEDKDIYNYSIYIHKKGNSGENLKGVEFMLEFKSEDVDSDGATIETWYPVYFVGEGNDRHMYYDIEGGLKNQKTLDEIIKYNEENPDNPIEYIFSTDDNGMIENIFTGLIAGDYRIVEVKTVDGYILNEKPITFSLPYEITVDIDDDGNLVGINKNILLNEENLLKGYPIESTDSDGNKKLTYAYNKVGFTIINKKQYIIPSAGRRSRWISVALGMVLLSTNLALLFETIKNRRQQS